MLPGLSAAIAAPSFGTKSSVTVATGPEGDPWVVPAGVSVIWAKLWGSGGGSGACRFEGVNSGPGGGGGYAEAYIPVTPGETITVVVGPGGDGGLSVDRAGGKSGYGPTAIIRSSTFLLVAPTGAGGGGTGNSATETGGAGAPGGNNVSGSSGSTAPNAGGGVGGGGASAPSTGGTGGTGGGAGTDGSAGVATDIPSPGTTNGSGPGGANANNGGGGGGGGGGYYGGGGGEGGDSTGGGGGGGGIGYTAANNWGTRFIAGSGATVANASDVDYVASTGNGGAAQSTNATDGITGQIGLIVIRY